jgi:hypothetical protein
MPFRPNISIFQIKKSLESFFEKTNPFIPLFHMLLINFARKGGPSKKFTNLRKKADLI